MTTSRDRSAPESRVGGAGTVVFQAGQRLSQTVRVPYSPNEWALLQGVFPMSEESWGAMIEVLREMKRGLVITESGNRTTPKSPEVEGVAGREETGGG